MKSLLSESQGILTTPFKAGARIPRREQRAQDPARCGRDVSEPVNVLEGTRQEEGDGRLLEFRGGGGRVVSSGLRFLASFGGPC